MNKKLKMIKITDIIKKNTAKNTDNFKVILSNCGFFRARQLQINCSIYASLLIPISVIIIVFIKFYVYYFPSLYLIILKVINNKINGIKDPR